MVETINHYKQYLNSINSIKNQFPIEIEEKNLPDIEQNSYKIE